MRYKNAKGRAKGTALENRYKKNTAHPKYYRNQIVHKILKLITTNPNLGVNQLTIKLNSGRPTVTDTLAGRHSVVTLLKELRLSTRLDRQNFARLYNAPKRLHFDIRAQVVREVLEEGKSVTEACRHWHIARKTFYTWKKRYLSQSQKNQKLAEQYARGSAHPKSFSNEIYTAVLDLVKENPTASIHTLVTLFKNERRQPVP